LTSAYWPVLDLVLIQKKTAIVNNYSTPARKPWHIQIHCAKAYKQQNKSKPNIILTLGERKFETVAGYNTAMNNISKPEVLK